MTGTGSTPVDKTDFTQRLLTDAGLRTGMRVLDVGCGSGDVTLLIAILAGETGSVLGIDRDEGALAKARERIVPGGGPAPRFVRADIDALPETLGSFDAIVRRRVLMTSRTPYRPFAHSRGT